MNGKNRRYSLVITPSLQHALSRTKSPRHFVMLAMPQRTLMLFCCVFSRAEAESWTKLGADIDGEVAGERSGISEAAGPRGCALQRWQRRKCERGWGRGWCTACGDWRRHRGSLGACLRGTEPPYKSSEIACVGASVNWHRAEREQRRRCAQRRRSSRSGRRWRYRCCCHCGCCGAAGRWRYHCCCDIAATFIPRIDTGCGNWQPRARSRQQQRRTSSGGRHGAVIICLLPSHLLSTCNTRCQALNRLDYLPSAF